MIDPRADSPPTPETLVTVPAPPKESDDLSPDPALLAALAQATGGDSLDPAAFDSFLDSRLLAKPPATRESGAIWQPAWNHALIAITIALLLATEWFLRRRNGLA